DDETFRVLVASGATAGVTDLVVRPGEGIVGRVAQSRIAYFAPTDGEAAPFAVAHWIGDQTPVEMAYLPLTAGPELVGVLALAATEPIDDRARNLLQIVSGQLGAAIQNALSHQALR